MALGFKQKISLLVVTGLLMGSTSAIAASAPKKGALTVSGFVSPRIEQSLKTGIEGIHNAKTQRLREDAAWKLFDFLMVNEKSQKHRTKPPINQVERKSMITALQYVAAVLFDVDYVVGEFGKIIGPQVKLGDVLYKHRVLCKAYYLAARGKTAEAGQVLGTIKSKLVLPKDIAAETAQIAAGLPKVDEGKTKPSTLSSSSAPSIPVTSLFSPLPPPPPPPSASDDELDTSGSFPPPPPPPFSSPGGSLNDGPPDAPPIAPPLTSDDGPPKLTWRQQQDLEKAKSGGDPSSSSSDPSKEKEGKRLAPPAGGPQMAVFDPSKVKLKSGGASKAASSSGLVVPLHANDGAIDQGQWTAWTGEWVKKGQKEDFRSELIKYLTKAKQNLGIKSFFSTGNFSAEFDTYKYDEGKDTIVKK